MGVVAPSGRISPYHCLKSVAPVHAIRLVMRDGNLGTARITGFIRRAEAGLRVGKRLAHRPYARARDFPSMKSRFSTDQLAPPPGIT
jgi:hypothetical protein